jgi:hypothetical protein
MFPSNKQPEGLFALCKEFCNYVNAKILVPRQLIEGAKVALAVKKTHYPWMDYSKIAKGPKASAGSQRVTMTARYQEAIVALMRLAETETDA